MGCYDVLLKFEATSAQSAREAAEIIFNAFFIESTYQPDVFDVVSTETGESQEIEVSDLRNSSPLYGPNAIASRLRDTCKILVADVFTMDMGVIVYGKVQSGVIKVGDTVYCTIDGMTYISDVSGVSVGDNLCDSAYFTEDVGLLFKDSHAINYTAGNVLNAHGA